MQPTRFDRVLQRTKNNRFFAWLILASVAAIGLGQVTDAFEKLQKLTTVLSSESSAASSAARSKLSERKIAFSPENFVGAAHDGNYELVDTFLSAGMDPNALCSKRPGPALNHAALGGHTDIVYKLLKAGADPNGRSLGMTALMIAAFKGHIEIVNTLLENGATINEKMGNGHSALTGAVRSCHVFIAERLIKKGADVSLRDFMGKTLLMHSADSCEDNPEETKELMALLVSSGVSIDGRDDEGRNVFDFVKESGRGELIVYLGQLRAAQEG